MRVLLWLLRLYPRGFRVEFEAEMAETLREGRGEMIASTSREAVGLIAGMTCEWISLFGIWLDERFQWVCAVVAAAALQAFAYGVVLPLGPKATLGTGHELQRLGVWLAAITVLLEAGWMLAKARGGARRAQ